jgi:hypothetical protein
MYKGRAQCVSFQISANRGDRIVVCRERGAAPRSKFPAIIRAAETTS